ncbi:MAG: threonine--tRNA ligase [Gemmataceae bacterium]|nr:threonine--tRNA ligase [Gemmataceae bacterium]
MIKLKLPDGSSREVAPGSRPRDVAQAIGPRLAQAAIAAKVDGEIHDLDRELPPGEHSFQVLTEKDKESLDVLRHSAAHVMARAILRLFPGAKLAFGPTIENGFYYDIDSEPLVREDEFPRIEAEMRKIVAAAEPFERFERSSEEASALCADMGQGYKVEHIRDLGHPSLSFYRQGEFIDLCRGPHIPHAGKIGAFKVLSIAGAYWKADHSRKQLQRLYGTAFFSPKELDAYLAQVEEAKKRDHRVLGKQLKLFTISQVAGSGLILWMPKGAAIRGMLETFIKDELVKRGYSPVYTPHIGKLEMYHASGHFPYYRDAQFPPMYMNPLVHMVDTWATLLKNDLMSEAQEKAFVAYLDSISNGPDPTDAKDDLPTYAIKQMRLDATALRQDYLIAPERQHVWVPEGTVKDAKLHALTVWMKQQEGYLLKPMNCPHHIQIYKAEPRSYRDLPVRLAEFGTVYRFEQTGELNGMTRVRGFTQDDAHLFVTPEQVEAEMEANIDLVLFVLEKLGLTDFKVRVSLRDPASDKYVGDPANWEIAEATLKKLVQGRRINHTIEPGEAAFYGPKIDFVVRDCIGREWQLGTVQLDYNLPERFGLEYVGADNKAHRPVMIHRAPFGSMERFMGILIEHFAGAFPLWLAPEQARVMPITDKSAEYAKGVVEKLTAAGFRVTGDYRPEKVNAKIAVASMEKIPYILVVGEKEAAAGTVSLRDESIADMKKRDQGALPLDEVIARFRAEVDEKRIRQVSTASAAMGDGAAKFGE